MDRNSELLRTIRRDQKGIEIAPWFAPLTPKRDGYDCLILDVLSREDLVARATSDPNVDKQKLALVETVDFVGSATEIEKLVAEKGMLGTFDYVISSHNFEHLPNPIRFLEGCAKVLKPDGLLVMAVPDYRGCFDHFRSPTPITEWLEAHAEGRERPSAAQVFTQGAFHSRQIKGESSETAFPITDDPADIQPYRTLAETYALWRQMKTAPDEVYRDTHCGAYSPAVLELLIRDCNHLGLVDLTVERMSPTNLFEFYVHLRNRRATSVSAAASLGDDESFYARRTELLRAVREEIARTSIWGWQQAYGPQHLTSINKFAADEIARLTEENEALKASTSWLITAPMRRLVHVQRRLRQKLDERRGNG